MTSPSASDGSDSSTAATPVIDARGIRKRYRSTVALDGVDLVVHPGEIVGLLGPNGAGKSTLVSVIAGVTRPDAGTVTVGSIAPTDRRVRTILGVQLQDAQFHDALTVDELVGLHASLHDAPADVDELLERLALTSKRRTRVSDLSGGQYQRLAIAIATVGMAPILVLDELSTGLDPRARDRVCGLVEERRDAGATVLLVSHQMDEVERLCDRIVLLVDGRVAVNGDLDSVLAAARAIDPAATTLSDAYLALTGSEVEIPEEDA